MRASRPMLLLVVVLFVGYSGGGLLLVWMGIWDPSYPFLSATRDAYLLVMTFLGGLAVCTYTTSVISLHIVNGISNGRDAVSTMLAFVGLGLGSRLVLYGTSQLFVDIGGTP